MKEGWNEPIVDIVSDAEKYRADAVAQLEAVQGGAPLAPGMTKDEAIRILTENIAIYDVTIHRYRRDI